MVTSYNTLRSLLLVGYDKFLMHCGGRAKSTALPLGTSPILHGLYNVQYSLYLPTSCILHVYVISCYGFGTTPTCILLLHGGPYIHASSKVLSGQVSECAIMQGRVNLIQ
jgi:hypothetical protein